MKLAAVLSTTVRSNSFRSLPCLARADEKRSSGEGGGRRNNLSSLETFSAPFPGFLHIFVNEILLLVSDFRIPEH